MPEFSPTQYAVPLFVLAVLLEMLWSRLRRPEAYEPMDTLVSLCFGLGSTVAGALFGGFAAYVFIEAYQYRFFDLGPEWWAVLWAWPLCFVLDDLKYYWVHRAGHRIRWMWAAHVNHHSSQHYNLSTALRQTWTGSFTFGLLFAIPLVLLGFHPAMIAICGSIDHRVDEIPLSARVEEKGITATDRLHTKQHSQFEIFVWVTSINSGPVTFDELGCFRQHLQLGLLLCWRQ